MEAGPGIAWPALGIQRRDVEQDPMLAQRPDEYAASGVHQALVVVGMAAVVVLFTRVRGSQGIAQNLPDRSSENQGQGEQ